MADTLVRHTVINTSQTISWDDVRVLRWYQDVSCRSFESCRWLAGAFIKLASHNKNCHLKARCTSQKLFHFLWASLKQLLWLLQLSCCGGALLGNNNWYFSVIKSTVGQLFKVSQQVSTKYLGDQSGVAHGGRQTDSQPLQVAVDDVRLGDEGECAQVSQTYSSQNDVAELPAGRLDHRSVPESTRT